MVVCINPVCSHVDIPQPPQEACPRCGSPLQLENRYWVSKLVEVQEFGKTYEVEDHGVVKLMKVLLISDAQAVAIFQQEARILSQISHPGTPKIDPDGYFTFHPQGRLSSLHCLVLEKITGITLTEWLGARGQPLDQEQAIAWLKDLVDILDCVHGQLYFHRDIQPDNIIVTPDNRLVLVNFGCGREIARNYLVKVNGGNGSSFDEPEPKLAIVPGYTPEEQAKGRAVPQSDYFSLGRTFVYLLTGKSPQDFMEDPRTGELLWQHRAGHVSAGLTDLIDCLMAKRPGNRPHNTQMILSRLTTLDFVPIASVPTAQDRSTERALLKARTLKRRQEFNYARVWEAARPRQRLVISRPLLVLLTFMFLAVLGLALAMILTTTFSADWLYQVEQQLVEPHKK